MMAINDKKLEDMVLGTNINPNELNLIYADGAIGVHDLYKQFGLHISYEKADEIWGDYSQDVCYISFLDFPKEKVTKDFKYAAYLFIQLYLYENKVVFDDGTASYVEDALKYAGFIEQENLN